MKRKEVKTPEYTRRAIDKYKSGFDFVSVRLPAGTKSRMDAAGMTPADRAAALMAELEKREAERGKTDDAGRG